MAFSTAAILCEETRRLPLVQMYDNVNDGPTCVMVLVGHFRMSILELDCYSRYLTPTVVHGTPVALNSAHHMDSCTYLVVQFYLSSYLGTSHHIGDILVLSKTPPSHKKKRSGELS